MKAVIIPAILAATVLVAGIFAFMPVEKASTVHTTIQSSISNVGFTKHHHVIGGPSADTIQCSSDKPFILHVGVTKSSISVGTLAVRFGDNDVFTYQVPAQGSFGLDIAGGGIPGVDGVLQFEPSTDVSLYTSISTQGDATAQYGTFTDQLGNTVPRFCTTNDAQFKPIPLT